MTDGPASEKLRRILGEDEELDWRTKPKKSAFLAVNIVKILGAFVLVGIFGSSMVFGIGMVVFGPQLGTAISGVLTIGILGIFVWLVFHAYDLAEFAVTSNRLIQFGGIIGRDYSTVRWEDVQDFEVDVGIIDKIFGTGSIIARPAGAVNTGGGSMGGQGVTFNYVEDPYDVLEWLEKHH